MQEKLTFGTGGMRALMGEGPDHMNETTVALATQGLAQYLLKKVAKPSVIIGYDSRHHSKEFAETAASVLAGNGIHVFLLEQLRPTPFVSFACREKKCSAGIMITASHNPKEYNGYKVYWSDGGQVVPPHDIGIMREASTVTTAKKGNPHLITRIGEELDLAYLNAIFPLQFRAEENEQRGKDLKITYTSLHGTGITLVPSALRQCGFTNLNFVEDQIQPDGDFPTVKFPNPEYPEALERGTRDLLKTHSDLLIATDPDADRVGVVCMHQGKPLSLTGNEIAAICVYYLCEIAHVEGAFVTTIVSTELIKKIASAYELPCIEVLTGFKYIAEKIHHWETTPGGFDFIFGAEESYGYLVGTVVRDKDAIIASCLIAEIALWAKESGRTLIDLIQEIYQEFGRIYETQLSLPLNMTLMKKLREHPPSVFCKEKVILFEDYSKGLHELPPADVLLFRLEDGSRIIIRPSGTEPKIKIYISTPKEEVEDLVESIKEELC